MNRGKWDIIASILTATQKDALKGYIVSKCRLSNTEFDEYVKPLLENGLVDAFPAVNLKKHTSGRAKSKRTMIFHTTETGKRFLKLYGEISALVERHVADPFWRSRILSPSFGERFAHVPQTR